MALRIIPDIVSEHLVHSLGPGASAREAAEQMARNDVSAIAVVDDGGVLVGIVTERDLTRRVVARDLPAADTRLGDIMTGDPRTLVADDNANEAIELMLSLGIRHVPVVEDGRPIAMVSMRNLQRSIADYSSRLAL